MLASAPSRSEVMFSSCSFSRSLKLSLVYRRSVSRDSSFCSANTLCGRDSGSSDMHHSVTSIRLSE